MARKLRITTGRSRYDRSLKRHEAGWPALVKKLTEFTITDESFVDYVNAGNDKLAIKDVGWYVGGHFEPNVRRRDNLVSRSILTLDADHLEPGDDVLSAYSDLELVWHTSHSHSPETPRLRLVFPLSRDVTPEEYEPLARAVAATVGMDYFDDTCYQVSRIMFWPSCSSDGEHDAGHQEGDWLDPDFVLGLTYSDPNDFGEWPLSSREQESGGTSRGLKKVTPAWEKPGIVGEFNRAFEVPVAIEVFDLPYVVSGMGEGRYSYGPGTSVDGAIYYPDDGHLHSWHESDPARGTHSSWDLVRLHRFGALDNGLDPSTPIQERPSQKAMTDFVHRNDEVMAVVRGGEFDQLDPATIKSSIETSDDAVSAGAGHTFASLLQIAKDDPPMTADDRIDFWNSVLGAGLKAPHVNDLIATLIAGPYARQKGMLEAEYKEAAKGYKHQDAEGDGSDIELALIQEMLDRFYAGGDHIRRVAGSYWTYQHGVWQRVDDEIVSSKLVQMVASLRKRSKKDTRRLELAVESTDMSTIIGKLGKVLAARLAGMTEVDGDDPLHLLQKKPPVMNCLNGELWFDEDGSFELRPHDASNMFTTQLAVTYDPAAECPEWDRLCGLAFSNSVFPDELKRHLEEIGGYILQMSRDMKSIFVFYGATNAGKSSIVGMLTRMLGRSATSRDLTEIQNDNHGIASLQGKLLAVDDDKSMRGALDDGFLKKVSEAKFMTANPKNANTFEFMCLAVPLVVANELPRIGSSDPAILDRLKIVGFPRSMSREEVDLQRAAVMERESAGVLNRLVAGYARLKKRGRFEEPFECAELRAEWKLDADPVARWLNECLEHTGDPKDMVQQSVLHPRYKNWMVHENLGRYIKGRNHFLTAVKDQIGGAFGVKDGYPVLRGYRFRTDEFDEEDAD